MTEYAGGSPPAVRVISVTKGCGRKFTVQRVDTNGSPVNFNATVFIDIDIDRTSPTRINAAVTNSFAALTLPATVCDLVKATTKWRVCMDTDAADPTPLLVGSFERNDG